jgi:hypothetical protein
LVRVPVNDALPAYQVALFRRAGVPPTPAAHRPVVELERESAYQGAQTAPPRGRDRSGR